jgi:N-acetylmuramoyl-L-alanine amidase
VRSLAAAALLVAGYAAAAGCAAGGGPRSAAEPAVTPTPSVAPATPTPTPAAAATSAVEAAPALTPPASPAAAAPARVRVVVLDPGHDGGNAAHPEVINRQVPAGGGRTKPCNTVGSSTNAGYPEHAFTWDVALRTRSLLAAHRIKVVLTRPTDTGVGPCVDVRGRFGAAVRADAVVSVHADGAAPGASGFHVIEASGTRGAVAVAAHRLAVAVHDAMRSRSGLHVATYIGSGDGYDARADLAGLTLATRPSVLVEAGNMRNAGDAALQSDAAGRQRIAAALAAGILAYLG